MANKPCVDLNMKDPVVRKALEDRVSKITATNETLRDRLKEQLKRGLALGESVEEIAKRLRTEFRMQAIRAHGIAQDIVQGLASDARSLQAKKKYGKNFDKEWIDRGDGLVRPSHRIGGQRVRADKKYSNGLSRPHDPTAPAKEVCGCRCMEVYHPRDDN